MVKRKIYRLSAEEYNAKFYNNWDFIKTFSLSSAKKGRKIYRVPSGLYIFKK
jgi:hypothetical protein